MKKKTLLTICGGYAFFIFIACFGDAWFLSSMPEDAQMVEIAESVPALFNALATQKAETDTNENRHNARRFFGKVTGRTPETNDVHQTVPAQLFLQAKNYDIGPCGADGIYGDDVKKAVAAYQKDRHLSSAAGDLTPETLQRMAVETANDKDLRTRLDQELIAPFRTEKIKNFLKKDLPRTLKWDYGLALFWRPDIIPRAINGLFLFGGGYASGEEKVYPGCVDGNPHRRDAFRHAAKILAISSTLGTEWAKTLGNLREKKGDLEHTLPETLTDLYNHDIAASIAKETPFKTRQDVTDTVIANIHNGRFLTYPFPLVPKTETTPTLSMR